MTIDQQLGQFAVEYLTGRGSSVREINSMANDGSLIQNAVTNYTNDKKYLTEQGFLDSEVKSLGTDIGAIAQTYNPEIDRNEFLNQFQKQKAPEYSVAEDYEKLEDKVIEGVNWGAVRDVAGKAAMVALYAGGAMAGMAMTGEAMAEQDDLGWYHWSPADFNGDFAVDELDLSMLAEDWLTTDYAQTYQNGEFGNGTDMNGDGKVNLVDFVKFASEWNYDVSDSSIGKMKAEVFRDYDPANGWLIFTYNIHNLVDAPNDDFEINEVHFMAGTNDGVDPIGVVVYPDSIGEPNPNTTWTPNVDDYELQTSTIGGEPDRIIPGDYKTIELWVVDAADPNDTGLDYLHAFTEGEQNNPGTYLMQSIKAPMPNRD